MNVVTSSSCRPFEDPGLAREPLLASDDFGHGRFESALARSERFVMTSPRESWCWRFKGECLLGLDRPADAAVCFGRALELGGEGTEDTALWKAIAERRAGDLDAAAETLKAFLATAPKASLALGAERILASLSDTAVTEPRSEESTSEGE